MTMDNYQDSRRLNLEKALADESVDPIDLPFWFLEAITDNFSDKQHIGSGGFGSVYKGALRNGMIVAVKKLHNNIVVSEDDFKREVACLIGVKHRNIVRFLGYSYETQHIFLPHEGRLVLADKPNMLFCFEFLRKGSLANYLTGPSSGLQWGLRYKIIKEVCEGVGYLHQQHITHMDLKPDNILLDDSMVPKIADFGLSRRFSGNKSKIITKHIVGSRGYMAPEFLKGGIITFKADIYSLGVIVIEILVGCKERPNVDTVLESWKNTFGTSNSGPLLEQVKLCAKIGIDCMHDDPNRRPDIQDIIHRINEIVQLGSTFYRDKQVRKPMRTTASVAQKGKEDLNLESSGKDPQSIDDLLKRAQELGGEVHPAMSTAVVCPPRDDADPNSLKKNDAYPKVISRCSYVQDLKGIDVHPTHPWILMGHDKLLSIWHYKMEVFTVYSVDINDKAGMSHHMIHGDAVVTEVRFIPRMEWCVAGDDKGYIHVYACPKMGQILRFKMDQILRFKATGRHVTSLSIHPTCPYLLSTTASDKDNDSVIEVWNWENGWACSRRVKNDSWSELGTFINPMDANTFGTFNPLKGLIKVWSINPSTYQPITTIQCPGLSACRDIVDHVFMEAASSGRNDHVVIINWSAPQIWDLHTGRPVHTLFSPDSRLRNKFTVAACHPTLPLIAAIAILDYSAQPTQLAICFWNSTNFRLEKTIWWTFDGLIFYLRFVDSRRLVIGNLRRTEVLEIDMEALFDSSEQRLFFSSETVFSSASGKISSSFQLYRT